MTATNALFTVEESHGKPRLTGPRLSDIGTVPTEGDRSGDHGTDGRFLHRNKAAADRTAKRALSAPLRAARARVVAATESAPAGTSDALLADAMAVYESTRRELGTRSTLVLSSLAFHATETVLAGHFTKRAAEVGLETDEAGRLIDLSHSCQTQAKHALTAALATTKALGGKRTKRTKSKVELISERALASLAERNGGTDDQAP